MRAILIAGFVVMLGCAGPTSVPITAGWIYSSTKTTTDQFKGITTTESPWITSFETRGALNLRRTLYKTFLREIAGDGRRPSLQLYVRVEYRDWAFLDHAADSSGQQLSVTEIKRDTDCGVNYGCVLTEDIAVNLDRAYLRRHSNTGLKIKVWGRRGAGTRVVDVGPAEIQGFLARLEGRLPAPVPASPAPR